MKTVMDKARSTNSKGKVNNKFSQYLKDFSVELKPCMAGRPQTKGKVESSMKLPEEIHAYQGRLDYKELLELIEKLNNRVNINIHQETNKIPIKLLETEKDLLNPLPRKKIRDLYKISKSIVKVNSSNMITYKGNQYSIPNEYANTILTIETLSTYFIKCQDLIENFKKAQLKNRLESRLKNYAKYKLLIIDEFEYLPINNGDEKLLFQLIDKRYKRKSTIITTNLNFDEWSNYLVMKK